MPRYKAEDLRRLTTAIFRKQGTQEEEAEILSNHLVNANLAGVDSHGVMRIPEYIELIRFGTIGGAPFYRIVPDGKFEIVKDNGSTVLVNGNWCFGQVTAWKCMLLAIERAKRDGISAVAAFNTAHTGRLGEYTALAAEQDMVAFMFCNIGRLVAAFGGTERVLGTNPLSVGIPTTRRPPFVLDLSTAVQSEGKIRNHRIDGTGIPLGWILDADGNPSTNPEDLYKGGSILPLGGDFGYKGYGLALMIEILGAMLAGSGFPGYPGYHFGASGPLMIVLDVKRFVSLDTFKSGVDLLLKQVKGSRRRPGVEEILIPGETGWRNTCRNSEDGIELSAQVVDSIKGAADFVGVNLDDYLAELR